MTVPLGYGGSFGAPAAVKPPLPADHEEGEPKDGVNVLIGSRADPAKRLGLKDGKAAMVGGEITEDQYWKVEKHGAEGKFVLRNAVKENTRLKGDKKLQPWGEGRAGSMDGGSVPTEALWTFKQDRLGWRLVHQETGGNLVYGASGAEDLFLVEHATMGGRDYGDAEIWDVYESLITPEEKAEIAAEKGATFCANGHILARTVGWGRSPCEPVYGTNNRWPGNCWHSSGGDGPANGGPYWKAKFDAPKTISRVEIINRADCCWQRLRGAKVMVGTTLIGTSTAPRGGW